MTSGLELLHALLRESGGRYRVEIAVKYSLSMPDFAAAATRHYGDASFLHTDSRFATADHLAGIAAECGLKAILVAFLGGSLSPAGIPTAMVSGRLKEYKLHVDRLWPQIAIVAHGRIAARFTTLISMANPFVHWSIDDRYEDGSAVTAADAVGHLDAAKKIVDLLQQAQTDGFLS